MSAREAEVAARIREARRLAGLSQEDVAHALDTSVKTLARWEKGETSGFLGRLDELAPALRTTREALLGEPEAVKPEAAAPDAARIDALEARVAALETAFVKLSARLP